MDTEDFTFPRISDTYAHNIDSPPLWTLSPAASPNFIQAQSQRKSFSCVENGRKRIGFDGDDDGDDEDEEEEKMDLLWEDFNEELSSTTTGSATSSSSREVVEFRRAQPLIRVAKTNNNRSTISIKNNPSMVVIVKVIKKLFSINNSQRKHTKKVR